MKHFLVIVDIQKDFVDGALGTPEAVAAVEGSYTGQYLKKILEREAAL